MPTYTAKASQGDGIQWVIGDGVWRPLRTVDEKVKIPVPKGRVDLEAQLGGKVRDNMPRGWRVAFFRDMPGPDDVTGGDDYWLPRPYDVPGFDWWSKTQQHTTTVDDYEFIYVGVKAWGGGKLGIDNRIVKVDLR